MRHLIIGERSRGGDYVTLDAAPGATLQATVPPLPPEVTCTEWDRIEMIHFLEHLYLWDARRLLKDCYDALAPGGTLVIECPDISYCARVLIGDIEPPAWAAPGQFDMWGLFGNPDYEDPLYGHRWGYTPDSLKAELVRAGFEPEKIVVCLAQHHHALRDFRMEAVK